MCLARLQVFAVAFHHGLIPEGGILRRAFLRGIIHVNQPKALAVTIRPLVIIHQRPGKVARGVYAVLRRAAIGQQIAAHVILAVRIMHMAVERDGVVRGHAVFGDDERRLIALIEEFRPPIERIRANRPADGRSRFADCARHFFIAFGVVGGTEKTAVVDILRVEIQRLADQSQVVFPALRQRAEKMPAGRYPGILSAPRERSLHPIARITAFAWI